MVFSFQNVNKWGIQFAVEWFVGSYFLTILV